MNPKLKIALVALLSALLEDVNASTAATQTAAEEPEAPTLEGLRELASTLLTAGRKPEVLAVLKKYKVAALKELNSKHYPAVHAALTALVDSE